MKELLLKYERMILTQGNIYVIAKNEVDAVKKYQKLTKSTDIVAHQVPRYEQAILIKITDALCRDCMELAMHAETILKTFLTEKLVYQIWSN